MKKGMHVILKLLPMLILSSGCSQERVIDVSGEAILLRNYKEACEFVPSSLTNRYIYQVRRNSLGNNLLITVASKLITVTSNDNEVEITAAPAVCSFYNERKEAVAWFNDMKEGVYFRNGNLRPLALQERFGVETGGAYFYISTYSNYSSVVYSMSQPESPLLTIPSFVTYAIFFCDSTIYVFGTPPSKVGAADRKDICYEIAKSNDTYCVQRTFEIPGAVVDMSPTSKRLLLDNRSDLIPLWFLYDMETEKKRFISKRDLYGFFITSDLANRFKEKTKQTDNPIVK